MGVVYRAKHLHLDRTVALKVLTAELASNPDFRERFLRESRTAASIQHPSIVTIYDAGEADGLLYIAMQYVEGTDLGGLIRQEGALEPERAVAFLAQVAGALDAAHAHGVVHRDVKPANVLVQSDRCYLTDFGLTKPLSAHTQLTSRGEFVGTVHYMAPEQIEGADVDGRTDVYALGCLAFHALAGRVPFERDSEVSVVHAHLNDRPPPLTSARPDLPTGFDTVLDRALAKRREDRQSSCGELVAGLQAELAGSAGAPALADEATAVKLLVAAVEPRGRALVRASVQGAQVQVLEAGDVRSALSVARKERPRIALIDCDDEGGSFAADICTALKADTETARHQDHHDRGSPGGPSGRCPLPCRRLDRQAVLAAAAPVQGARPDRRGLRLVVPERGHGLPPDDPVDHEPVGPLEAHHRGLGVRAEQAIAPGRRTRPATACPGSG